MARYSPWIVSQHVPDFSTLDALVNSPSLAGKEVQELAIALWEMMVDRDLGIFHYFPAREDLWKQAAFDPLKIFNVFRSHRARRSTKIRRWSRTSPIRPFPTTCPIGSLKTSARSTR